jgi:hypothetical protein
MKDLNRAQGFIDFKYHGERCVKENPSSLVPGSAVVKRVARKAVIDFAVRRA